MGKLAKAQDESPIEIDHSGISLAASPKENSRLAESASGDATPPSRDAGGPSRLGLRRWCYERLYRTFIEPLVSSRNPPWFDARGVTIGLIVGLMVPIGGHIVSLTLLRMTVRFNFLAALAFTFVCNPLNVIPLYYGYYLLGCGILGSSVSITFETFRVLMNSVLDKTYFWEATSAFVHLGREILVRWFVAAVVLSVVFGVVGYVVTLRVQTARLKAAAERLGESYERLLTQLDHHPRADKGSSTLT